MTIFTVGILPRGHPASTAVLGPLVLVRARLCSDRLVLGPAGTVQVEQAGTGAGMVSATVIEVASG